MAHLPFKSGSIRALIIAAIGSVLAAPGLLGTGGGAGQRPSAGTKSGHLA